jgi:hypothetical protein
MKSILAMLELGPDHREGAAAWRERGRSDGRAAQERGGATAETSSPKRSAKKPRKVARKVAAGQKC